MIKHFHRLLIFLVPVIMVAQEPAFTEVSGEQETAPEIEVIPVGMDFEDVSFFVETPSSSIVHLPVEVEYPIVEFLDQGPFRLLDYIILPSSGRSGPSLEVRWYPLSEGLTTFPSIQVITDTAVYRTNPSQLLIKAPVKSAEMSLEFVPEKRKVYAGEPLRVDVVWSSSVSTKRIRSLNCYPSFFNNPDLEFSIPRTTDPESKQLGIPFGGRRIIARREADPDNAQALGTVSFPLYIKFGEPGTVSLEEAYLQCAQLHQDGGPLAPYAAYYNNGLFENVEKGIGYDKIFTESEAVVIEVLPLPEEGRSENFSGLFMPCSISSKITPTEGNVGQLMDLEIIVTSPAASDFIQLPPLDRQKGLRSWFKVDPDYTRTWLPEGSNFSARIRALTTRIKAIPSLKFQVFDPASGEYLDIQTTPIPITVNPQDGKDYFDSKVLLDTSTNLTTQDDGIWNNRGTTMIHDILDTVLRITSDHFWLLLILGPIVFAIALPRMFEYRRRELDPVYRKQINAYNRFLKLPEGDVSKWDALKELIAVSHHVEPGSWTVGDSKEKLPNSGIDSDTIEIICNCHKIVDTEDYASGKPKKELPVLKNTGQNLFKILRKLSLVILFGIALCGTDTRAQDWDSATAQFDSAMLEEPGSVEYFLSFSKAALQYEAVARSGEHPGRAWYNAGNSWFNAGEIGRSIACYKHAIVHRPFDQLVKKNLTAARALAVDVVEANDRPVWMSWPVRWVGFLIILSTFIFWGLLLGYLRYRTRPLLSLTGASLLIVVLLGIVGMYSTFLRKQPGVVVVPEVYGRKGPGYNYLTAFHEPLHDGLEFEVVKTHTDWLEIMLTDGRICWIPESQVQLIDLTL